VRARNSIVCAGARGRGWVTQAWGHMGAGAARSHGNGRLVGPVSLGDGPLVHHPR
jgi:hypothetical protein